MRFRAATGCARAAILTLAWLGWPACSGSTPPPEPVSFERPTRVAFACVDVNQPLGTEEGLLPMDSCRTVPRTGTDPVLHALVLQSGRGEVAAVDVRAWRVLDSRADIPGKTFVPVGEVPVALVAAPDPRYVYVANSASRDISVVRTASVLRLSGDRAATVQRVALKPMDSDATVEPFDMVLSPDNDALFVSSRANGALLRVPICGDAADGCEPGQLDASGVLRIPLDGSWSKLPAQAFMPDNAGAEEPYRYVCDDSPELRDVPDLTPELPSPDADVGAPKPAGLAVDAFCEPGSCTRRLLIADARQPIVHAVDLDALSTDAPADAVLAPILTGAPTERVVVTPPVPVALTSDDTTQYVYAIDGRDGSVLVTQDGRVRNVNVDPAQRPDRLNLGPSIASASLVALSLEILTPYYDPNSDPSAWWVHRNDMPTTLDNPLECVDNSHQRRYSERLRGVFLAVGATDGTVRIVNVHDMELRDCRSCTLGETPSYSPFRPGYDPLPVIRNRTRFRTYVPSDYSVVPRLSPTVLPQFAVEGATIGVKADGTTNDTRVPGLDCVFCGAGQAVSFPTDETTPASSTSDDDAGVDTPSVADTVCAASQGDGRVCSLSDPYVDPPSWLAIYEGSIPGTLGGRGRFVDAMSEENQTGALEFVGDVMFCSAGVLGSDQLDVGDQLTITSALPPDSLREERGVTLSAAERDVCNKLIDGRDKDNTPIVFGIKAAYADRLQITSSLLKSVGVEADWEAVKKCFAGLPLTYQIRTRDSFVVYDSNYTRFQHHVIADADDGHCVNDPTRKDEPTGRAYKGETFDNGYVAFRLKPGSYTPLTLLRLASGSNAPKLLLSAGDASGTSGWQGVMPVDLRYSPIDQHLYIVDITSRGLMRLPLNPMPSTLSSIDTIQ